MLGHLQRLYIIIIDCNKKQVHYYIDYMVKEGSFEEIDSLNLFGEVTPNEIVRIFRDDQLTWIDDIPLVNAYFDKG
jgi:hypothetical protein